MKRRRARLAFAITTALIASLRTVGAQPSSVPNPPCDQACLAKVIDDVIAAMT